MRTEKLRGATVVVFFGIAALACNKQSAGDCKQGNIERCKADCEATSPHVEGACVTLGDMYANGTNGVTKSDDDAVKWWKRECAGPDETGEQSPAACLRLGRAYMQGKGAPKDAKRAKYYLGAACTVDSKSEACALLDQL